MKKYVQMIGISLCIGWGSLFGIHLEASSKDVDMNAILIDLTTSKTYTTKEDISNIKEDSEVAIKIDIDTLTKDHIEIQVHNYTGIKSITALTWNGVPLHEQNGINAWVNVSSNKQNQLVIKAIASYTNIGISCSIKQKDDSTYTKGFLFAKSENITSLQQETIDISFYTPSGKQIKYQKIEKGTSIQLPVYELYGYNIIGYQNNHTNELYKGEAIYASTNFYAVVEAKKFHVYYYVNQQLYEHKLVTYHSIIPKVQPPIKEGYTFIEWIGITKHVDSDVNVYALYEKDGYIVFENEVIAKQEDENIEEILKQKLIQIHSEELENTKQQDYNDMKIIRIQNGEEFVVNEEVHPNIKMQTNTQPTTSNLYIWLGCICIGIGIFIYFKKNK